MVQEKYKYYCAADVYLRDDYYPFGMIMPGRNYNANEYRFGFNGQEKDDEITGVTGSHLDFGARLLDTRIGRWLAVDPLAMKYPDLTPYQYTANNPILFIDPDGKKIWIYDQESGDKILYVPGEMDVANQSQFVQDVVAGLDYLRTEGIQDGTNRVQDLVEMKENLYIQKNQYSSYMTNVPYDSEEPLLKYNALNWCNDIVDVWPSGKAGTPVSSLAHEIDHAWRFFPVLREYLNSEKTAADWDKISPYIKTTPNDPKRQDLEDKAIDYENYINGEEVRTEYNSPVWSYPAKNIFSTEEDDNPSSETQKAVEYMNQGKKAPVSN